MGKNETVSAYMPVELVGLMIDYCRKIDRPFSYAMTQAAARYLIAVGAIPLAGELSPNTEWREIERRLDAAKGDMTDQDWNIVRWAERLNND
jgi:hypothetical protein